jgi:hypothetical protein
MTEDENSFDTPHEINTAIRESLKQTRSLKITDMAGMNSIAVGLNEVAKITVEGTAGNYFGAFNGAATLRLLGDAGNYAGDSMSGGILRIEGTAKFGTGTYIQGGSLNVLGNCGAATGQRMYNGVITIKGNTGPLAGVGMKGGMIFVNGKCGDRAGHNMEGGVIYARKFKSMGTNAMELPLTKIDKSRLIEYLEIDELEIEEFKKVVPRDDETSLDDDFPVVLHDTPEGYLDKIILTPSYGMYNVDDILEIDGIEMNTKLGTGLGTMKLEAPFMIYDTGFTSPTVLKEAVELKIPVISTELPAPSRFDAGEDDDDDDDSPSGNRVVRILPEREGITVDSLNRGRGVELVIGTGAGFFVGGDLISSMPERQLDINTKDDIRHFIELIREVTHGMKAVFVTVSGENIYDLVMALTRGKPDAIIIKSQIPTSALTVAREALDDADRRDRIKLYVLGDLKDSEDIYKLLAMGADGIALVFQDTGAKVETAKEAFSLHRMVEEFRVLMAYSGNHTLADIKADDLRAVNYSTAAVTGIKLVGYDQKLPIWRR